MTAYSFYCSRCKKDHAGECPPETGKAVEFARACDELAASQSPPPVTPAPGTLWDQEVLYQGTWTSSHSIYRVTSVDLGNNTATVVANWVATAVPVSIDLGHWSPAGRRGKLGNVWRFVAAP